MSVRLFIYGNQWVYRKCLSSIQLVSLKQLQILNSLPFAKFSSTYSSHFAEGFSKTFWPGGQFAKTFPGLFKSSIAHHR